MFYTKKISYKYREKPRLDLPEATSYRQDSPPFACFFFVYSNQMPDKLL